MLSRFADCLYWLGRYLERVDTSARLVEAALLHASDARDAAAPDALWRALLCISGGLTVYGEVYADGRLTGPRVVRFMTQERSNPGSIRHSLRLARDDARTVRDHISGAMWEIVNELWLHAEPHLTAVDEGDTMVGFARFVRGEVARYHGVTMSTMMRGEAFGYQQLGRFVERAELTARILDVAAGLPSSAPTLLEPSPASPAAGALLASLSGFEASRRLQVPERDGTATTAALVFAPDVPCSLRFSVERIVRSLAAVDGGLQTTAPARIAAALRAELAAGTTPTDRPLRGFLSAFIARMAALDRAVHDAYLGAPRDGASVQGGPGPSGGHQQQ